MDAAICFLILFACCAFFPLLAKAPFLLRVLRKKETFEAKPFWLSVGLNAGFDFLFCLIVYLFFLLFNPPLWYRALYLYGTLALLFSLLKAGERVFAFIKNKKVDKPSGLRVFGTMGLVLAFLMFDGLYFNRAALKSNRESFDVSPTSSYVTQINGFTVEDNSLRAKTNNPSLIVENLPENILYATFDFESTNSEFTLEVAIPNGTSWKTVNSCSVNASHAEYCQINLVETSSSYRFTFKAETTRENNDKNYVLKGICFNKAIPYNYSLGRGLLVLLACYICVKIPSYAAKKGGSASKTGRIKLFLAGGFLLSCISVLIAGAVMEKGPSNLLVEYPLNMDKYKDYDIFVQLFDGFFKGHLHLDYEADPKLVALGSDAYDPALRSAAKASVLFDHAFYNGKYYCYFGVAPVIFISFPVYAITGGLVPTGFFFLWMGFFASVFGFIYLGIVLMEAFKIKPNPLAYGALIFCLLCGGLFFNLVVFRRTDFMYRVPFTLGLANVILFTAFSLEAYRGFHRRTFLGLAGFFYVLVIGSRPDFGFWVLFLAPLFLSMLIRGEKPLSKRLLDFVPMAAVLLVGGGFLIAYNVLRYGSPFEFGQTYQMTSYDMRTIKLELSDFRGALYHFFLQPSIGRSTFGYIGTTYTSMPFDSHPYHGTTIGLLYSPIPYFALLLVPCFLKEKRIELRITYVLMPLTVMLLSWSIYGLAGTCFRYMLGIYPLTALIALFAIARFFSFEWDPNTKKMASYALLGGCIACFVFGMNLVPGTFDGMRGEDMNGIVYYGIRDILGAYNTL